MIRALPAARSAKIAMTGSLALFALLVAFNNLTDYGSNYRFVRHVLSMDTTFAGNALMYRALDMPVMWHVSYVIIIIGELATGIVLSMATVALMRAWRSDAASFDRAKTLVHAGVMLGFLVWFTGFMVIGGEWFAMWQSRIWNGQDPAFRFFVTMLLVVIYVSQPEPVCVAGSDVA
ncbi:MAG: DUF2165 family protein [Janthinobacterium lividum]